MTSNVLQDLLSVHGGKKLEHAAGMTTSVAVVALPKQLDRVRLIGTEEKHATLLFLGEMSTLPNEARNELLQTLRQVSEIVAPFTERILKVERLGEETPPALVCKLRDNRLSQIRDMLMVNHRVEEYLSNTQQYPSYTPHVTLGYPDYAQEAELRKTVDGISGITFDRIALWWGQERLEFPLKEYAYLDEDKPMEKSAAWSEEAETVLAHIAVEGGGGGSKKKFNEAMVKRDKGGKFATRAERRQALLDSLDSAWLQKDAAVMLTAYLLLDNKKDLVAIFKDFEKKYPLKKGEDPTPAQQKEAWEAVADHMNKKPKTTVSPSGTRRLEFSVDKKGVIKGKIVPYNGPNPHPASTKAKIADERYISKVNRAALKDDSDGLVFNPKAQLDTSRIRDASDSDGDKPTESGLGAWLKRQLDLEHSEPDEGSLVHAERTVQDILDEMTPEQRELMDLLVGAAIEGTDVSGTPDILTKYGELSLEQQDLIDFVVGAAISDDEFVAHSDVLTDFLAHFGVKGMKWGVRRSEASLVRRASRDGRKAIRAKVKSGTATLAEAHQAGLKTTGHRVANAVLGDKTYWKRAAIIAGTTATGIGVSFVAPMVMPAGVLSAIGASAAGTSGVAGHIVVDGTITTTAALGQQILTGAGLAATQVGNTAAGTYNSVTSITRAIRGNSQINKSMASLGKMANARQTAGTARMNKILNQHGSIRKRDLRHSIEVSEEATFNDVVGEFLSHFGIKGMRWGVRRTDAQLANDPASPTSPAAKQLSADAAKFAAALAKDPDEMSDAELREATARGQALQNYNRLFNSDSSSSSPLEAQVRELRLIKEKRDLEAALTPAERSRVEALKSGAATSFKVYKQIDNVVGGKLSKGLMAKVGFKEAVDPLVAAKRQADLLKAQKNTMEYQQAIAKMTPKPPPVPRQLSLIEKRATLFNQAAKADVADAKALNDSLDIYLSNRQSTANRFSVPPVQGPSLPKKGTSDYGLSLIDRQIAAMKKGSGPTTTSTTSSSRDFTSIYKDSPERERYF